MQEANATEISRHALDRLESDEILGLGLMAIAVGGFFINTLVLLLFYCRPALRTSSNAFVVNLSVAHLLQLVLIVPSSVTSFLGTTAAAGWCDASAVLKVWLDLVIVHSLLLIAFDRHVAVHTPLHYSRTITRRRIEVLVVALWLAALLMVLPVNFLPVAFQPEIHVCMVYWVSRTHGVLLKTYACFLTCLGFCFPLLFLAVIYTSMYRAAKFNTARARRYSYTYSENCLSDHDKSEFDLPSPPKKKISTHSVASSYIHHHGNLVSLFGEEWRAAKTSFLMVFSFLVCWGPFFGTIMAQAFYVTPQELPYPILSLSSILTLLASLVNPYLYVFRNVTNREQMCELFCCTRAQHVAPPPVKTTLTPPYKTCMIVQVLQNGHYDNTILKPPTQEQQWRVVENEGFQETSDEDHSASRKRTVVTFKDNSGEPSRLASFHILPAGSNLLIRPKEDLLFSSATNLRTEPPGGDLSAASPEKVIIIRKLSKSTPIFLEM